MEDAEWRMRTHEKLAPLFLSLLLSPERVLLVVSLFNFSSFFLRVLPTLSFFDRFDCC